MLGKTVVRVLVGGLFAGHGAQKLFGKFGGKGLTGTGDAFEQIGLRPGVPMAAAAGVSELVGGSLVALGLMTPLGTAMLSGVMASAIERVHLRNGPWNSDGGYEYPLVLTGVLAYFADEGPGVISLDRLRGRDRHGPFRMIAGLGAGVAGAMAIRSLAERSKPLPPSPGSSSAPSSPTGVTADEDRTRSAGPGSAGPASGPGSGPGSSERPSSDAAQPQAPEVGRRRVGDETTPNGATPAGHSTTSPGA